MEVHEGKHWISGLRFLFIYSFLSIGETMAALTRTKTSVLKKYLFLLEKKLKYKASLLFSSCLYNPADLEDFRQAL